MSKLQNSCFGVAKLSFSLVLHLFSFAFVLLVHRYIVQKLFLLKLLLSAKSFFDTHTIRLKPRYEFQPFGLPLF